MRTQSSRRLFGTFLPLVGMFLVALALLSASGQRASRLGRLPGCGVRNHRHRRVSREHRGPHASMTIKAPTATSGTSCWRRRPARQQAGLKDGMIPVGSKVTAHGHRHRDSNRFEVKTERLTWGDKVFNVYPDRS